MGDWTVERAADVLLDAEAACQDIEPLSDSWDSLDLSTAYAVQDETLRRRLARASGW
jgi:2-oxo-3-hexenedioate decarboxylase